MFPLMGPAMPAIEGPPTPEMVGHLSIVKVSVIAVYFCAGARVFAGDPFGALNDVFASLFGTFLLKDDPHLAGCYRLLLETPIGTCGRGGGLACLMPFMCMAGLNLVFGVLRVFSLLSRYGTLVPCNYSFTCISPVLLAVSTAIQLVAVYQSWQVMKLMQVQASGGALRSGMYERTAAGPGSGGEGPPATRETGSGGGPGIAMNHLRGASFQPFQGAGHTLGEG